MVSANTPSSKVGEPVQDSVAVRKRNEEIEALRGLAIIAVIISHIGNLVFWTPALATGVSRYGLANGVDLFFLISGYVITTAFYGPLKQVRDEGIAPFAYAAGVFMLRRIFRIMPAALTWIVIVCVCSKVFNTSWAFGEFRNDFADFISIALNISNFHFARCIENGYHGRCGFNAVYWSISLEEQFYLFFPLLVVWRKRWVFMLTVAVVTMLCIVHRTTLVWFTRVDGLLAGMCLAFFCTTTWYARVAPRCLHHSLLRGTAFSMLCAAIVLLPLMSAQLPRIYPELTVVCCLVIVGLASYDLGFVFAEGPFRQLLAYVGTRSFALYLVHNPAAWFMHETVVRLGGGSVGEAPAHAALYIVAGLSMDILLAELTYRLVEVPFRQWGRSLGRSGKSTGQFSQLPSPMRCL